MVKKKVAIIGAGLGGLSAALRLQSTGYNVDVYEKNSSVGGKAGEIRFDGFRFDLGPSLLTMPFVLKELFEAAGLKIEDFIELKQLNVVCKYFYPDSSQIIAYSDLDKFAAEIERSTIDNSHSLKEYLNYCKRIYDLSADLFLFNSFTEKRNLLKFNALRTLFNIRGLDTSRTMHAANSSFFKDDKTIQLFDRYATYNGSNPFKAPATLNIIQHVEYNLGAFISTNGIHSIPVAIKKAAEQLGVKFFTNSEVNEIVTTKNVVKGIKINGVIKNYDIVISNSDVENTYKNLLNDDFSRSAKKNIKLEKSTSAVVFYWGVNGNYPDLEIHNILFSRDYKNEFNQLFKHKIIPIDPTVYIYISSKFKSDDAPEGKENWFVMVNAPHKSGQNWDDEINRARQIIYNKIKTILKIDIENRILCEEILTPQKIEDITGSMRGSIYGISSNNKMAAFLRQQNKSKEYKGLYFCGGSVHPGGGIPLVILSGKITANLINMN